MNKSTQIQVVIDENGETNIEVINGDGKTCTDLTKAIEDSIGLVTSREFKPEHRSKFTPGSVQIKPVPTVKN